MTLALVSVRCPICRAYLPPSRDQAWHEATKSHRDNVREPERRSRNGTRPERTTR